MSIKVESVRVTTTGEDAAATGNADSKPIRGEVLGIFLDYHASTPATADVTIKAVDPADYNLLVVNNNTTDGYYAPRAKPVDNANSAITNAHAPFAVNGKVNVALAGGNALTDAVVAYIYYRDD